VMKNWKYPVMKDLIIPRLLFDYLDKILVDNFKKHPTPSKKIILIFLYLNVIKEVGRLTKRRAYRLTKRIY